RLALASVPEVPARDRRDRRRDAGRVEGRGPARARDAEGRLPEARRPPEGDAPAARREPLRSGDRQARIEFDDRSAAQPRRGRAARRRTLGTARSRDLMADQQRYMRGAFVAYEPGKYPDSAVYIPFRSNPES